MKNVILCVGLTPAVQELREFARLQMGEVNRATRVSISTAGKGVNTAHVLRTLGERPLLLQFIGGHTGDLVLADLARWDIEQASVRIAAPTRLCITLKDASTGEITELVQEGALPSRREWQAFFRACAAHLNEARMLTLSGTLMPGAAPDIYRRIAALAAKAGVPLLIDSHNEPLRAALPLRPLVAKLNVRELENTTGKRLTSEQAVLRAARSLIEAGAQHAVVTNGREGAWLVSAQRAWHYTSPRVPVVNPIGSGDAVSAGIAAGLARGQPLEEAMRLGVACGAANVVTAAPASLSRALAHRLLRAVKITAVAQA